MLKLLVIDAVGCRLCLIAFLPVASVTTITFLDAGAILVFVAAVLVIGWRCAQR